MSRKSIPEATRLKLWVKSAGRCQFKGCNKYVWHNGLTLSEGNFSEVAHIIGAKEKGPRGTEDSEELQIEYGNLMLLCRECHKEIDTNREQYPHNLLKEWKAEHEQRIEIQTSKIDDINRSNVVVFSVNIGDRYTPIHMDAIRNAMFPKYPVDLNGLKIEDQGFDRLQKQEYWQNFAEKKIKKKIERFMEDGIDDTKIKHLSIFAIGPMPLLFYLGKCFGDTVPADIFQSHREIENTSQTWTWKESSEPFDYKIVCEKKGIGNIVFLILSISDVVSQDRYVNLLTEDCSVYHISADNPSPHFLKSKEKLARYSEVYRKTLNTIQNTHGSNCKIYIIPAVPVSVAVESGRILLPTKDPDMFICEYNKEKSTFETVLQVNSSSSE